MNKDTSRPVLCYVDKPWAYFTTQPLSDQWGDDWDDAPYEHNAGSPYEFQKPCIDKSIKPWEIIKVAFYADLETPCDNCTNSDWSVEQINAGAVAWLFSPSWASGKKIAIQAGTTLDEFARLVKSIGGKIYMEDKSE